MIKYDLLCGQDHPFEGWFSSSDDFKSQNDKGLITCPLCGDSAIHKALVAPNISTGRQREAARHALAEQITKAKHTIKETFTNVGENFAKEARAMHEGLTAPKPIYGQASQDEVKALIKDDVPIAPLPDVLNPDDRHLN